jgi:DNA polymerase elongation subunit (family B)
MCEKDVTKAIRFLKTKLQEIVDKKVKVDKLLVSKALRGHYKNPHQIAHWVLANRIGKRDSGNKPNIGDRISYLYINNKTRGALQGDRIETPEYVKDNRLEIDYSHYILNCVMKPVQQIFALLLEEIPEFRKDLKFFQKQVRCLHRKHHDGSEFGGQKYMDAVDKLRNKETKKLLFDGYIRQTDNRNNGSQSIMSFFGK